MMPLPHLLLPSYRYLFVVAVFLEERPDNKSCPNRTCVRNKLCTAYKVSSFTRSVERCEECASKWTGGVNLPAAVHVYVHQNKMPRGIIRSFGPIMLLSRRFLKTNQKINERTPDTHTHAQETGLRDVILVRPSSKTTPQQTNKAVEKV